MNNNDEQEEMYELINKITRHIQINKITFHEFTEYYHLCVGLKNDNFPGWRNLLNNLLSASVILITDEDIKLFEEYKNNLQSLIDATNKR